MNCILTLFEEHGVAINAIFTFATVVIGFITILQAHHHSKKEQKRFEKELEVNKAQYEVTLREQRKQFETQIKHSEEVIRIQEQPWLVFFSADISQNIDGTLLLNIVLKNKGRGAAYSIQPSTKCTITSAKGEKTIRRQGPVQDPVIIVGEQFKTAFVVGQEENIPSFDTCFRISFNDASGRVYKQQFDIIVNNDGFGYITNYAVPQLETE